MIILITFLAFKIQNDKVINKINEKIIITIISLIKIIRLTNMKTAKKLEIEIIAKSPKWTQRHQINSENKKTSILVPLFLLQYSTNFNGFLAWRTFKPPH